MLENKGSFGGVFTVECRDADGQLKWTEEFPNLVVNTGLQSINTQFFKGITYTASWFMGLVTGPGAGNTYAAGNTMLSHAGWTENTAYVQTARPTMAFGTATTADPSVIVTSAPVVFTMNASAIIAGAFVTTDNVKGGTAGTLFSVGNFTVGDRTIVSGDTLNVTYTFSADAA
jgi:hypothetical protein